MQAGRSFSFAPLLQISYTILQDGQEKAKTSQYKRSESQSAV